MPFIDHDGVKIHFAVEGRGPALVLHHGLGRSLAMWRDGGYVAALKNDFRLVMIDARGHGDSGKPQRPDDYRADLLVGDVLAVLDGIGVPTAHFLGFCLGAQVGWQIGAHRLARFRSLALLGLAHYGPLTDEQRRYGESLQHSLAYDGSAGDGTGHTALLACRKGIDQWPALEDEMAATFIPCLLVMGDKDPGYAGAQAFARRSTAARLATLRGVHHKPAEYSAARVLPHLQPFLSAASIGLRL